ncbi:hypothetical protein DL98DRAFT_586022 [Cadophora sp. DSE1049]|nr:hypothetical protein DL98DRAFT_586022 [Cadophora sp. DSE1049]
MTDPYTYMMEQEGFTCVICREWIDDPHASSCNTAEHEALGFLWYWEEVNQNPSSKPKKPISLPKPQSLIDGDKSNKVDLTGGEDSSLNSSSPAPSQSRSDQSANTAKTPATSPDEAKKRYEINRGPG